jgi:hypothetical protein
MWQEFHDRFANQISEQLLPRLKPKYVALLTKRYVIDRSITIYPDVHVLKETAVAYAVAPVAVAAPGVSLPVELRNPLPEHVPHLSIEIRDVAERRLVTVIEILSPVNKHGEGVRDYHEKRMAILATDTHLLEIDLLRHGTRIELDGTLPPAPYYVILSRWTHRPRADVCPIQLRDKLPRVPVPLLPPDPDVVLDLQAALDACFELVGYERLLDYSQPLADLSAEDAAWVGERVQRVEVEGGKK